MGNASIVFVDIAGSTEIFGWLGNTLAAEVITKTTHWIGKLCETHGGRVIQFLGDGVLVHFSDNNRAVEAVVDLQLRHVDRQRAMAFDCPIKLKVGVAYGDVLEQDGHCFGDVVNVASGLSHLAGPDQILVTDLVALYLTPTARANTRRLGSIGIRGRTEPCVVYQVDWMREASSSFVTVQAFLDTSKPSVEETQVCISLAWKETRMRFTPAELPLYLGRVSHANFVVNDPRVSRLHAKVSMRADQFVLEDVSSFGTSVRFAASKAPVSLRRQDCVLVQSGDIALAPNFDEADVPVVRFSLEALAV